MWPQALPDYHGNIFGRGVQCLEFFGVQIQVAVVVAVQHLALNEVAQALQVVHIARVGVYGTGQAYRQVVVVAMVVRVIALAKNQLIVVVAPRRIVQAVGGVEVFGAANCNLHRRT